jgi:deoxyadenosine kinase
MKVDDDSSSPLPSLAVSPTMLSKIRSLHNPNIAIAGNIAVGKSTLAAALSAALGLPLYKEEVSGNPVLPLFYADMKAHSFVLQIHLLNKRFEQERLISCSGKGGIQDRTIYEDHIFAKALHDAGLMTTLEYNTYLMTAENMFKGMDRPNLIIFLWAPPEVCFDRKELRCNQNPGREMEKQTVTLEYLTTLDAGYEDFMGDLSKIIPVLKGAFSKRLRFTRPSDFLQ